MSIHHLAVRIERAWCAETSADPTGWSPSNPALGQCAVTTLIVQDYYGGELRRALVDGQSHYWNALPGGAEVDLTIRQFRAGRREGLVIARSREYVLGFVDTARRYQTLKALVETMA